MKPETKSFLATRTQLWKVMVIVALLAALPRFMWMLNGQYNRVIIIFSLFAILPFVLLTRTGRHDIGFRKLKVVPILWTFMLGCFMALIVYGVGYAFFKHTSLHWFVTTMHTFDNTAPMEAIKSNFFYFLLFSLPVMIFSPIGEEFFFRGLLHESMAARFTGPTPLLADTAFFGISHLAHYGIVKENGSWVILPSAILWVLLMMVTAAVFYAVKKRTGSIWAAVSCHAGFNFMMMYCIFYFIA